MTIRIVGLGIMLLACFLIPFVFLYLNYKHHLKNDINPRGKSKWLMFFLPPGWH